ncbi:MAG TPA: protein kinase [Kofleriaceae bacterium]
MSHRYEIIAPLAQGGQGEIVLARRVGPAGFAKLVVLKKPRETLRSRALVTALIEEARLLAQINHTNVCQVHDLEEADGEFFLALEYLEGLTAWEVLLRAEESGAPIEVGALCGMIAQACDGLAAIHKLHGGVVHRDISPSNLFVTEAGTVKILDLGIAKSPDSTEHTPFGNVKGKLTYMSPEQVQGRGVDARADLFALGLVLYDLANAKRPARDRVGALAAIEVGAMPRPLAEVITRATAADVSQRYASAAEMGAALRAAGTALGSFYERGELAEWLATRFATELEHRRTRLAIDDDTASQTARSRVLTMRSALHDAVEPPPSFTGGTERLPLPAHERLTSSAYFGAEQIGTRGGPAAKRRRGAILIAGTAAVAVAVATGLLIGRQLRQTGSEQAPARAAMEPPRGPQPQQEPATRSSQEPQPASQEARSQPEPQPASQEARSQPEPAPSGKTAKLGEQNRPRHSASRVVVKPKGEGTLTVDSNPYALIKIDGAALGTTPIFRVTLAAGKHRVLATDPSGREQQQTIVIEEGREKRLRLDWSQP